MKASTLALLLASGGPLSPASAQYRMFSKSESKSKSKSKSKVGKSLEAKSSKVMSKSEAEAKSAKVMAKSSESSELSKSSKLSKSAKSKGAKSSKLSKASKSKSGGMGGDSDGSAAGGGGGGSSGGSSGGGGGSSGPAPDAEALRAQLRLYRDSLSEGLQRDRGYHADAADQVPDYNTCTIVQQCLDPDFILSLGLMDPPTRGHAYNAMSKVMSAESFNMLQLQQHGNMLLGEMQDWGTACNGHCRELNDPDGLLEPIVEVGLKAQSEEVPFLGYGECGNLRQEGRQTLWYCDEAPQMIHQANIDVATGKYKLGDIWNEPHIHGRNSWYDYFAAYGDLEEGGGPFGLRFSGHHIDLNYRFNGEGELIDDLPVFLGHNPLIVPAVHPPLKRGYDERIVEDHHYTPLLWANMAGIAQFPEAVGLVQAAANKLLDVATDAFVPLTEWESVGAFGALLPSGGRDYNDFPGHFDLATASEEDFDVIWDLVDYTLKFSRGHRSTAAEREDFRAGGKVLWTSQGDPVGAGSGTALGGFLTGLGAQLPLSEEDIRSNMNFLKVRVETDDVLFFIMSNQLFCVISESEPTNHLHSIYMKKDMMNADNACLDDASKAPGGLCESGKVTDFVDEHEEMLISNDYKFHSSMWEERLIKSDVTLDVDAFDAAVQKWSEDLCGLGITATLFDNNGDQVYQESFGTMHTPFVEGGYSLPTGFAPLEEGWTGDTVFTPFSNTKGTAAAAFIASVVDTGLGYLDEPISTSFSEIPEDSAIGTITPRMILSHTSGLNPLGFNRDDPEGDPYYACLYDDSTTMAECVVTHVLAEDNLVTEIGGVDLGPGTFVGYNNQAFDILAVIVERKTGLSSYGEAFQTYITEPLGMDDTTFDCPILRSTLEKPHVAWGLCSTGNDFPKFVGMLMNNGVGPDGTRVLSQYGVSQMFSHGQGNAVNSGDLLFGIPEIPALSFPVTRCYPRMKMYDGIPYDLPVNPFLGYGLGTMFFAGNKGEIFGHLGSTGGGWFVAPGRFAYYLAWMSNPRTVPITGSAYFYTADILNTLETASTFNVTSEFGEEHWEEIPTCGGGMFDDLYQHLGIESGKEFVDSLFPTCDAAEERRMTAETGSPSDPREDNIEAALKILRQL